MTSPKIDRYGWFQGDTCDDSSAGTDENEREMKWMKLLQRWDFYCANRYNQIAKCVREGIPDAVRSRAWLLITRADRAMQRDGAGTYAGYLQMDPTEAYEMIDRDLNRTFPQISFFAREEFASSLKRILYAYSQMDRALGYSQGMAFIAAMFLLYFDEETSFWAFHSVMTNDVTRQIDFFKGDKPMIMRASNMFEQLVKEDYNEVWKNLHRQNVLFPFFTTKWFVPAFLAMDWPSEMQLRIFEHFLFYGSRFLLSFGLIIIHVHRKALKRMRADEIMSLLPCPEKSEKMRKCSKVFKKLDDVWISKKRYDMLLAKFK